MKKERIDKLLFERGLADSRSKAQALVMAGVVLVGEKRVEKPSEMFSAEAAIRLKGDSPEARYVSRGGLKLEAALREFAVDPTGFVCLDIGASTGGFTDCLLQHGAARVVAVDAGTNQIVWRLREDDRIDVREQTNARDLLPVDFDTLFDLIVMDVSFISVTKIIPVLPPLLKDGGRVIILIKPQFEVGKGEVGKGGIVREPDKHQRVIEEVNASAFSYGFLTKGLIDSPITGAGGNKEFLALYMPEPPACAGGQAQVIRTTCMDTNGSNQKETPPKLVEGVDYYFEGGLMVLTGRYLKNRGYCCGNGCRHCPYDEKPHSKNSSSSL